MPLLEKTDGSKKFISGLNVKICTIYGNKQHSTVQKPVAHKVMLIPGTLLQQYFIHIITTECNIFQ